MPSRSTIYSPLFGASCPATVQLGQVEISPLTWEEFEAIEKHDVVMERAGRWFMSETLGMEAGLNAPPAIVSTQRESADPAPWPTTHADVVLALRLLGMSQFVEPVHTFWAESQSLLTHRHVAAYRMFGYTLLHAPVDIITAEIASQAMHLTGLVRKHGYTDILRPIRLLSGPSLSPNATALISLQILEAVYGQPSRRIAGLDYTARLRSAGVSQDDTDWLNDQGPAGGRGLRNATAHGRHIDPADAEQFRAVTIRAMRYFAQIPPDRSDKGAIDGFHRRLAHVT